MTGEPVKIVPLQPILPLSAESAPFSRFYPLQPILSPSADSASLPILPLCRFCPFADSAPLSRFYPLQSIAEGRLCSEMPTFRTAWGTGQGTSMKQWHFMDEHPIRTSTSMKQRHFMDKHPIRTSTSMEQRHFMDEESIDDGLATPGCHREASRRGCRAEVRPKHRQETGLTPVPDSLAT